MIAHRTLAPRPFGQRRCPKVCPPGRARSAIVPWKVQIHLAEHEAAAIAQGPRPARAERAGALPDLRHPAGNSAVGALLAGSSRLPVQRSGCGAGCGCASCGASAEAEEAAPVQRAPDGYDLDTGSLLALQRMAGNASVDRLVQGG